MRPLFPRTLNHELSAIEKLSTELWLLIANYLSFSEKATLAISTPFGAQYLSDSWVQLRDDKCQRLIFLLWNGKPPSGYTLCHPCAKYHKIHHWERFEMTRQAYVAWSRPIEPGVWHHSIEATLVKRQLVTNTLSVRPLSPKERRVFRNNFWTMWTECGAAYPVCGHMHASWLNDHPTSTGVHWALITHWRYGDGHARSWKKPISCTECSSEYAAKVNHHYPPRDGWIIASKKVFGEISDSIIQASFNQIRECAKTQAETPIPPGYKRALHWVKDNIVDRRLRLE